MDTRFLEYILALAETGNMTRAAKKLYISQPTLSQFLARQEAELGAALFQRANGKYTLTPVGELYAEYARKVLSMTEMLEKDIRRLSMATHIVIGTSTASALKMMVQILPDFCKAYPEAELTLADNYNMRTVSAAIGRGEMDIAFGTIPSPELHRGHSIELRREEVLLAVPREHPYARQLPGGEGHALTRAEFEERFSTTPLILQMDGSCIRYLVDNFLGNAPRTIACITNDAPSICEMVSSGIGIGFVPAGHAADHPGIICYPLEPGLCRIHSVLYREDLTLTEPFRLLIELAQNYMASRLRQG